MHSSSSSLRAQLRLAREEGLSGPSNDRLITDVLLKAYLSLLRDGQLNDRDYFTLLSRTGCEGVAFMASSLPKLGKAFDKGLGDGVFELPHNLFGSRRKNGMKSRLPSFLGSHFRRVFGPDGSLLDAPCIESIRAIRQVCFYAYKADLPYSPEKEAAVVRNFVECEKDLTEFVQIASREGGSLAVHPDDGGPSDPILKYASRLIGELFRDFNPEQIVPKHGPGATADCAVSQKWGHNERLSPLPASRSSVDHSEPDLLEEFGRYRWFNQNHAMDAPTAFLPWDPYAGWLRPEPIRHAKVLLVPKDSRGPRLISAEPVFSQFIQGGIQTYMYDKVESHPLTKGMVNFTKQSINQKLVLDGSSTGAWATLDLKDASDRVSMRLVDLLFSDAAPLRAALHTVRSRYTKLPDGTVFPFSAKHAPMGSAVCFPVMSTCIWGILVGGLTAAGLDCLRAAHSVYVYGDDIIVPSWFYRQAMLLLEHYGLKVNTDKSFCGQGFLESCGVFAFRGHDVSHCQLRSISGVGECTGNASPAASSKAANTAYVAAIAHANELREKGLYDCAEFWVQIARTFGPVPVVPSNSPLLGIKSPRSCEWSVVSTPSGPAQRGYVVRPNKVERPCNPWDHLRRIASGIGSGTVTGFGLYGLPRDFRLGIETVPHHLLNVGDYPEWLCDAFPGITK